MPRQKTQRAKPHNLTAHRRTVAHPRIKKLIGELRDSWDTIDRIERGDWLCELVQQGCSPRGLEKDLEHSATTIRRHMTLAALPDRDREAVKIGRSAKKILAKKADADRRRKIRERVLEDARTGQGSDRLADTILEFCHTVKGVPESPIGEYHLPTYLSEVRNALSRLEAFGARRTKIPARLNQRERFKSTRPPEEIGEEWMSHRARWLAILMLAEVPESPIRERALEKAGRRGKELRIPTTPMQLFQEKRRWLADLGNVPRRKVYEPAARNPKFRTARPVQPHSSDV